MVVRRVADWWDGVGELGNKMGPISPFPCWKVNLTAYLFTLQLSNTIHHFSQHTQIFTKENWMTRCARTKSMFTCLQLLSVSLCHLSINPFANSNYQNLHCMLATYAYIYAIISFSICTRVCIYIYIYISVCMHASSPKTKGLIFHIQHITVS